MTAIETEHLRLDIGHFQLDDVTLSFPEGQITAIVGPNGSGKSTLLKMISRLATADGGEIRVGGLPAGSYRATDFARVLTMLPQSKGMFPDLTVREIVAYGRSPHKRFLESRLSAEDREAIDWALAATDTGKHEDRPFHTLSGGEQQKVRIAMALAQKTGILLLDEPTTFLDMSHQLDVMEMLRKLNREWGMTIVMVLHDLQQAAAYSHHLVALKHGLVVAEGAPRAVITPRFLRYVYDIEAKVRFEEDYPIIIPVKKAKEDTTMVIVTNTSKISKGNAHKLIERFDKVGKVEFMEGFLGLEVLLTENTKDYEEVSVVTRWRQKEDFQAWTKSSAFKESHKHREIPDYILENKITFQEVKIVRDPRTADERPAAETEEAAG
ncbi:heme oxygenase [Cohnella massiliensis]|uniref:heme oxygenase n=1 Tax=Cohnella massiliensis TaxID=1816691 RepID=UPI0009BC51B3|nr:heme oxygenase [Cohnella massiliensis]